MLKKQHFELLKLIEKEKDLSKIAELLSLTERSIRYKIEEINEELGNIKIEIKRRRVYSFLTKDDTEKLLEAVENENYMYSQKEREELIILYTLFKKDTFLLKEVADKLSTSKSTVRNDIKDLKNILLKYNIKLLQDDKLKYYFDYSEEDYRYFMTIFLYKYVSFDEKYDKIFFDDIGYFRKLIYKGIKTEYISEIDSVSKRIKEAGLDFMDETLNFLVILMAVSQKRDDRNKNLEIENVELLKSMPEFSQLKKFFPDFSHINLLFFTDYLFRISRGEKFVTKRFKNWLEINVAISKIVQKFELENEIEFKNVDVLLDEIFYYIKPLIFRTKRKIELKNSILKDVKELYPVVFDSLKENFHYLDEAIGEKVSEDEIAYLTPFFYKSLQDNSKTNKRAILVTTYKENVALFLKEEIESEFLIDIEKILTLSNFEINKETFKRYDYILTTFTVDEDLITRNKSSKIVELNPILTEKDVKKLEDEGLVKNRKIKMSSLLKLILENSKEVDIKKLISSLNENFSEKIYNDIEKNKFSLNNFLKKEDIIKTNLKSFKEILQKILELSFLKKNDINAIIDNSKNIDTYTLLNDKILLIFYKRLKDEKNRNVLIAVNECDITVNKKKINTIILVNSDCETKYRGIIYNFVKLFFQNNEINVNNNRLQIYDYLISNI